MATAYLAPLRLLLDTWSVAPCVSCCRACFDFPSTLLDPRYAPEAASHPPAPTAVHSYSCPTDARGPVAGSPSPMTPPQQPQPPHSRTLTAQTQRKTALDGSRIALQVSRPPYAVHPSLGTAAAALRQIGAAAARPKAKRVTVTEASEQLPRSQGTSYTSVPWTRAIGPPTCSRARLGATGCGSAKRRWSACTRARRSSAAPQLFS